MSRLVAKCYDKCSNENCNELQRLHGLCPKCYQRSKWKRDHWFKRVESSVLHKSKEVRLSPMEAKELYEMIQVIIDIK